MSDPSPSETLRAAAARLLNGSPLVSEVVVEPLAAWLDGESHQIDQWPPTSVGYAHAVRLAVHALAFARSILEQP